MQKTNLIIIVLLSLSVVGCGTIKGVGKDLSSVGGWLSNSSEKVEESFE